MEQCSGIDPGRRSHGARYERDGYNYNQAPIILGAYRIYLSTPFYQQSCRTFLHALCCFYVLLMYRLAENTMHHLSYKSAVQGVNG